MPGSSYPGAQYPGEYDLASGATASETETLSTTDTVARTVVEARSDTETQTTGDDVRTGNVAFVRSDSESLPTSDSVSTPVAHPRAISETDTSSDSVARVDVAHRSESESIPTVPSVGISVHQIMSETVSVVDVEEDYFIRPGLHIMERGDSAHIPPTRPFYATIYSNQNQFKRTVGRLLNRPLLKSTLNGGFHPITVEVAGAADTSNVTAGDIIQLFDQNIGRMVYKGFVSDDPVDISSANSGEAAYTLEVDPMVTELGDNPVSTTAPYSRVYSAKTDVGQMVRDIVDACPHLDWNPTSIPLTGVKNIYTFDRSYTCLQAIEDCVKMAGSFYYYYVDEFGIVWFLEANMTKAPTYTIRMGVDYEATKYTAPVTQTKNWVHGIGGVPTGATNPIEYVYDNSANSPYGRRALMPPLEFSNVTDSNVLKSMISNYGRQLDRRFKSITFKIPASTDLYSLAQAGGPTMRYYEPASVPFNDEFAGAGGLSPTLVIVDVERDGAMQTITCVDMPVTIDDVSQITSSLTQSNLSKFNTTSFGDIGSPSLSTSGSGCGGFSILAKYSNTFSVTATGNDTVGDAAYILDSGGFVQVIVMARVSISTGTGSGWTAKFYNPPPEADCQVTAMTAPGNATLMGASLSGAADGSFNTGVTITGATGGTTLAGTVDILVFVYCNCTDQGSSSINPFTFGGDTSALSDGSSMGHADFDTTFSVTTPKPDRPVGPPAPNVFLIPLSGTENSSNWTWLSAVGGSSNSFVAAPAGPYAWPSAQANKTVAGTAFRTSGEVIVAVNIDFQNVQSATAFDAEFDVVVVPIGTNGVGQISGALTNHLNYALTTPDTPLTLTLGTGSQSGTYGAYVKIPTAGRWAAWLRMRIPVNQVHSGWLSQQQYDRTNDSAILAELAKIVNFSLTGVELGILRPPAYATPPVITFTGSIDVGKATPS